MPWGGKPPVGQLAVALAFFAAVAASAATADQEARRVLTYRNDRLSVHLASVPLEEVMVDLRQASGAEVYGSVREPRDHKPSHVGVLASAIALPSVSGR